MRKIKDKIIELSVKGLNYDQIAEQLNCSKGAISYHLGKGQKEKTRNRTKKRRKNPLLVKLESFFQNRIQVPRKQNLHKTRKLIQLKIETFHKDRKMNKYNKPTFTVEDVINKFGPNPKCYLSGEEIDLSKPRTYHFDHIIPSSRGGDNSIDNLGLCVSHVNFAKRDMTNDEFIEMCQKVVAYNEAVRSGAAPASSR